MIDNQCYKQPFYFSPTIKSLAITSVVLGAISTLAGGILFASNNQVIALGSLSALLTTLPPVLPIALCTIGASAILISAVYLFCLRRHVNSQYQQALICKDETNPSKNDVKAFELFYKAASSGHVLAELQLARCYRNGTGCKKDKVKAFQLVQKLADKGNQSAQFALIECIDRGIGCKQDSNKAFELLKKLASKKFVPAQFMMGEYYFNETQDLITKQSPNLKEIEQIKAEAIKWFTLVSNSKVNEKEELSRKEITYYINEAKATLKKLKLDFVQFSDE